mmetsp:Transcript_40468/g.64997  ORF Transcript_40468/g.64997 Transcript_40468/m.64997 type:complete len:94 (-) Transcript_40468:94-375(-)
MLVLMEKLYTPNVPVGSTTNVDVKADRVRTKIWERFRYAFRVGWAACRNDTIVMQLEIEQAIIGMATEDDIVVMLAVLRCSSSLGSERSFLFL